MVCIGCVASSSSIFCCILFYVNCFFGLQRSGFAFAHYENSWVSTPYLSPFDRFNWRSVESHSTCPLLTDNECGNISGSVSALSRPDGTSNADNVSSAVENAIPQAEEALEAKSSRNCDAAELSKEERVSDAIPESVITPEQRPIAPFDEWTKEKLKMGEQKKNNQQNNRQYDNVNQVLNGDKASSKSSTAATDLVTGTSDVVNAAPTIHQEAAQRNYASRECGAKVLFSNEETENKNAVLNEKEKDDYMRNPCEGAQHKWLIIELCETVQPTVIELANFELFSSGPRDFRLLASERYPSNEWVSLGEFVAEDTRNVQRFPILAARVYAKFIRLELLTHHGHEHYCTLSLVRVLGVSMVDEYEAEAEAASVPLVSNVFSQKDVVETVIPPSSYHEDNTQIKSTVHDVESSSQNDSRSAVHETDGSSSKNRTIVDAVVNAVENFGFLKNAFESALGKWTDSRGNVRRMNRSLREQCRSCPAPGSRLFSAIFCYAFFPTLYTRTLKGPRSGAYSSAARTDVTDMEVPSKQRFSAPTEKGSAVGTARKYANICRKRSARKRFLVAITASKICRPHELHGDDAPKEVAREQTKDNCTEKSAPVNPVPVPPPVPDTSQFHSKGGQYLPGVSMSHKESVFLKLNKRISALELNMSLSSEYLSELSRRYVEQTNDSHRQLEKTLKMAEEIAVNAARGTREDLKLQVDEMAKELKELSHIVRTVTGRTLLTESSLKKRLTEKERDDDNVSVEDNISCELDGQENDLLQRQPHLLYSNDHMWTTEQLVYMVILAQLCTVALMVIVQCCYQRRKVLDIVALEKLVDERIKNFPIVCSHCQGRSQGEGDEDQRDESCSRKLSETSDSFDSTPSVTLMPSESSSEVESDHLSAAQVINDCSVSLSHVDWSCTKSGDTSKEGCDMGVSPCVSGRSRSCHETRENSNFELLKGQSQDRSLESTLRTPLAPKQQTLGCSCAPRKSSPEWQIVKTKAIKRKVKRNSVNRAG